MVPQLQTNFFGDINTLLGIRLTLTPLLNQRNIGNEKEKIRMNSDKILDAKGLACPMPIVKTKKALNELEFGQILEIHATDKGAKNDLTAWAKSTGNELSNQRKKTKYLNFG
jgi:tRNA 2-thiouridine synthesizing protein A